MLQLSVAEARLRVEHALMVGLTARLLDRHGSHSCRPPRPRRLCVSAVSGMNGRQVWTRPVARTMPRS